jgi:hypothetical protein
LVRDAARVLAGDDDLPRIRADVRPDERCYRSLDLRTRRDRRRTRCRASASGCFAHGFDDRAGTVE